MFTFKTFELENDRFYRKKVTLSFSEFIGLTFLKGVNHDAKTPVADTKPKKASNGTGKTRLIQLLEGFIFGKTFRGNFKRMVLPTFKGTLVFEDKAGDLWSFTLSIKEGWRILKNGLEFDYSHQASKCLKKLQTLLGITREEWSYFVSINQKSLNTLIHGQPSERKTYLENFFSIDGFYAKQLDAYKAELKTLEKEVADIKTNRIRLEEVKIALAKLPDDDSIRSSLAEIDVELKTLILENSSHTAKQAVLLGQIDSWESYHKLFTQLQSMDVNQLRAEHTSLLETKLELEKKARDKIQLDSFLRTKLTPHQTRKPKSTHPKPSAERPDSDLLAEKVSVLNQMREKLRLKKLITPLAKEIETFAASITMSIADIESSIKEMHKEKSEIQSHFNLLNKGGDVCPTCKQSLGFILEGLSVTDKIQVIRNRLLEIKCLEDACASQQKIHTEHAKLVSQHNTLTAEFARFPVFGVKLTDAETEFESLKSLNQHWEMYIKEQDAELKWKSTNDVLLVEAKNLGYPQALEIDCSKELADTRDKLLVVEGELKQFERFEALTDIVIALPPLADLEKQKQELLDRFNEITARLGTLNEQKGTLKAQQVQREDLSGIEATILKKVINQEELESDCKVLEAMNVFYSPSGFKLYELKKRCARLVERANYWSSLFFQEPHHWSLSEDVEDLNFFVQPLDDPDTEPFPVGEFSAGELNRAVRVLLFSLLELIPPSKKTNLLVLDEIESNLDEIGMVAFLDVVLPKLKEIFKDKAIIVISHQNSLQTSGVIDHLLFAERKDRMTTLSTFPNYHRRAA